MFYYYENVETKTIFTKNFTKLQHDMSYFAVAYVLN